MSVENEQVIPLDASGHRWILVDADGCLCTLMASGEHQPRPVASIGSQQVPMDA